MRVFARILKPLAMSGALLAMFGVAQIAKADPLTVSGFSSGTVTGTAAQFLSFTGNTFTATTARATPIDVGAFSGADRLGTFTLSSAVGDTPVSGNFVLHLTFTTPTGILGGQGQTYNSFINGVVSSTDTGGVRIVFEIPVRTFLFPDASGFGFFNLELPKVFVQSGDTAELTGGLSSDHDLGLTVPEPATVILLGTGLAGVAAKVRRRRKEPQRVV